MKSLQSEDFEKVVLNRKRKAVVLFSNDWNGSVVMLKSTLLELENEYKKEIDFYEIGERLANDIHNQYGVKKIPTIFIFNNSEVYRVIEGIPSKSELIKVLKSLVIIH